MADSVEPKKSSIDATTIVGLVIGFLIFALYGGGAAKLSYDKYGSIGWAMLAFIFAPVYYPIYAYFISSRSTVLIGGIRRLKY